MALKLKAKLVQWDTPEFYHLNTLRLYVTLKDHTEKLKENVKKKVEWKCHANITCHVCGLCVTFYYLDTVVRDRIFMLGVHLETVKQNTSHVKKMRYCNLIGQGRLNNGGTSDFFVQL